MMRDARYKIGAEKTVNGCGGFSLLEIMLVLFVISMLSAVMAPLVFQFVDDRRETATRQEIETVQRAIFGKPSVGQYGYVGDMGGLPGTLADLNTNPGVPAYSSSGHVNGVGMGWNGPYLNIGYSSDDYLKDAWGRNYTYDNVTGQLTSLGSDGAASTNDDIVIPPYPADTTGGLSVTVTVYDSNPPGGPVSVDDSCAEVDVYYASNGSEAVLDDITWNGTDGVFEATDLHQGLHAVEVTGIDSCDTFSNTINANAVISKGTTSLTIFLGTFDIP